MKALEIRAMYGGGPLEGPYQIIFPSDLKSSLFLAAGTPGYDPFNVSALRTKGSLLLSSVL